MMMAIFQISLYIVLCLITVLIYSKSGKNKVSTKKIILISLLFALYNMICTNFSTRTVGDRANYLYEFLGYRSTSTGLTYIFKFVKLFSSNINVAFYLITFICCFITFYCFFNNKYANKYSLIFLLITDYIFFTFIALKQCFVCAIASLIFYLIFNKGTKYKYVISAILVYIACLFHSTGFLLIPIVLTFFLYRRKKFKPTLLIIILLIIMLSFNGLLSFIVNNFSNYMPTLTGKIIEYFYTDGIYTESKLAFLKGLPFYFISIIGVFNYKKYSIIKNYDKLLVLSFIGSFAYFITFISYWMYRITAIFYLPISLLFGYVYINEKKAKNRLLYFIICILLELIILVRWLYMEFMSGGF